MHFSTVPVREGTLQVKSRKGQGWNLNESCPCSVIPYIVCHPWREKGRELECGDRNCLLPS